MNILFVLAHPDDEAYGPGGTIAKLATQHTVLLHVLCNGARPGSEHVSEPRLAALKQSCQLLGADLIVGDVPDLGLEYRSTTQSIERTISHFKPTVVYTNNISDINTDHRVTAESALIACRPKPGSCVQELYFSEMPSSTTWTFHQLHPIFEPSTFVDISNCIQTKRAALELYDTEIYDTPDARSVMSMYSLASYRGHSVGVRYAEAFKQVFALR
jgi:LmbE family N-acetylglucosaminyl deacetylase